MRQAFRSADENGRGEIDGVEFASWLRTLDERVGQAEQEGQTLPRQTRVVIESVAKFRESCRDQVSGLGWSQLFKRSDTDGSGLRDVEEFIAAMRIACNVSR